jgi:hypothetical protein
MAWSTVSTEIQNPAHRRKKKNMAKRHLTAKQVRYFGTKRQKAALRSKRNHKHRANPPRKKRAVARHTKKRAASRKKSSHRARTVKHNPVAEIISWTAGNPARKKGRKMAHRKKAKARARHNTAGRPRKSRAVRHHHRRRNPGFLGSPMNWVQGGAGVLAGVVGTRALPQIVLGGSNTGAMGYAANAATALALGWVTHMFFPRNPILTGSVIAGGFAATLARIISDRTPFGAQLSLTGLGDWGLGLYQKSNFNNPQFIRGPRGRESSMFSWGPSGMAAPMPVAGADSREPC